MKNQTPALKILKVLLPVLLVFLFYLPSCTQADVQDQLALFTMKEASFNTQVDSLMKKYNIKSDQYDTIYSKFTTLSTDFEALSAKNKSLQSGSNKKGADLKKAAEENAALSKMLQAKSLENDSLQNVIIMMQQKMADTDNKKAEAEKNNAVLARSLKEQKEKIVADSIAIANKPLPPKESGFVSITEVGGAFGLDDVSVDYSRRLLSFTTVAAYRINQHFLTGIGTGIHFYNGGILVPAYIDLRWSLNEGEGHMTPFVSADAGFMFSVKKFWSSGLFINPAIGMSKKLSNNASMNVSTGLLIQTSPVGLRYSFINIKGGVMFRGK